MAELDLTNIAASSIATPAAGVSAFFTDNVAKRPFLKDDGGNLVGVLTNQSVTTPAAGFAADTYLVGSSILLPNGFARVGTCYRLSFDVTKTAAGVAAPVLIVRFGTAGSVADAARLTFTFNIQTAVVDNGIFDIIALFRTVGSGTLAVLQGISNLRHNLAVTGLGSVNPAGWQSLIVTSAGFDSTPNGSIIGCSVNGGAAAAWTISLVRASLENL